MQRKDLVTVLHRGETEPEWTGGLPPSGGHVHPTDLLPARRSRWPAACGARPAPSGTNRPWWRAAPAPCSRAI
jgi:hypothetical protein